MLAFAFGRRQPVLDTNVRRVLARLVGGVEFPPPAVTVAEKALATELLPDDEPTAATWSVALMELGALVCTAASPAVRRLPGRATRAPGAPPATRRTTDHRGAARPGRAPTGSAVVG